MPFLLKERTGIRLVHRLEVLRLFREGLYERARRAVGKLRRRRIEHDDDRIRLLRKCRIELDFALSPR